MTFPWANTILLLLVAVELISGVFGLTAGSADRAFHLQIHRVAGYGIVAVLAWKTVNVIGSLRWPQPAAARLLSLTLTALLLTTLALGLAWSLAGPFHWWLFSGVSWHIYIGAGLAPLLVWHAWYMVRGTPIGYWAERRLFFRLTGAAVVGVVGWQASETIARAAELPGTSRRFTGSYNAGDFSGNDFPRVSWLNDRPQRIDVGAWTLDVFGAVEQSVTLTYADLVGQTELTATLDCTGGWHSTQMWSGVPLADVLTRAAPTRDARSIVVRSVTGYYRRFSLDAANDFVLATSVSGEILEHGHGYPLRLVAPGRRGFEWVKWVTEIEVSEAPAWWQPPLPVR